MGQSTDGILFWGFPLPEGEEYLFDAEPYDGDAGDYYRIEVKGFPRPDRDLPGYRELFTKWIFTHQDVGCELGYYCSCDYSMRYVCITVSANTANRGEAIRLTKDKLTVGDDWGEKLKTYCDELGIEWQEPDWYLVSMWC